MKFQRGEGRLEDFMSGIERYVREVIAGVFGGSVPQPAEPAGTVPSVAGMVGEGKPTRHPQRRETTEGATSPYRPSPLS